jgi:photosystem II stability/assembly factor-like uncharacterized protein
MNTFVVVTAEAALIARRSGKWSVETHLSGKAPECLAVDPRDPARMFCGTWGHGLWRSFDGGKNWAQIGEGIPYDVFTSLAFDLPEGAASGVLFAGTQPSALYRSEDGGRTWRELPGLKALPSSSEWSFPPNPRTHHVRWIEPDPTFPGRIYAAIEAGALVRTLNGGETWLDRVAGGPYDTHTAAAHPTAAGRVYSAAGDGYYESADAGETWSRAMAGLQHSYLVGLTVNPVDPDTVIVSAASSPRVAYTPRSAEAYVYRKTAGGSFSFAMDGLPAGPGTTASRFSWHPETLGVLFAANNHGLFNSEDGGITWRLLEIPWPARPFGRGAKAVAVFDL